MLKQQQNLFQNFRMMTKRSKRKTSPYSTTKSKHNSSGNWEQDVPYHCYDNFCDQNVKDSENEPKECVQSEYNPKESVLYSGPEEYETDNTDPESQEIDYP